MKNLFSYITSSKMTLVLSLAGVYLLSTGVSLVAFSKLNKNTPVVTTTSSARKTRVNLSAPKTEECPINGAKYTAEEKNMWEKHRPITAMIENHADARPESGLSKADVVYEAVAEGGITRFMSVFYCGTAAENVKAAPIRSARIYYVNFAAGYGTNPIFLHQGGANDFCADCPGGVKPRSEIDPQVNAYAVLDKLKWRNGQYGNDMDGGFNIGFPIIVRNQYRLSSTPAAWEHSVVADLDEVYKEADKRGFTNVDKNGTPWTDGFRKWLFQDGLASASPSTSDIKFSFWSGKPEYDVEWKYDSASNSYKRFNGGAEHKDWEFDKPQLSAKNVVIMFAKEKGPVDTEHHLFYQVIGTGKALIFQNGQVIEGTWSKNSQLDREVFYDTNGKEVQIVRGQTWVEIVPSGNTVDYK
ncbi:DUF3048 domain-containing protein [Candidatus Woesebacteria bacterium]|nr:DUF3048 domain-containing protein [Candidatus Woesebacteria bacterium]